MKKIKTIDQFVEFFFSKNEKALRENYPGLGLNRLRQTFLEYFGKQGCEAFLVDEQNPLLGRLLEGEPLEYILNKSYFFTSSFYVNQNVLIPRSETEILVEDAIDLIRKRGYRSFADVGAGSGCVAVSILASFYEQSGSKTKRHYPLQAVAIDICPKALEVCETNVFRHQNQIPKDSSITCLLGDRFDPLEKNNQKVDLIVSNPPYIDWDADRDGVHSQTDMKEPKIALYLNGKDYQEWFEEFFESAYHRLENGGALLMEGHEDKLQGLKKIAQKRFLNVSVKQDYTRRDRFLRAFKDE